ncbi:MAG: hypothetical protein ACE5OQ_06255 [Woeseia sp.]
MKFDKTIVTRMGLHSVATLYTGGSIAHILRLVYDLPLQEMPYIIDWIIVILGSLGAAILIGQTRRIEYRGKWEKPVHFLIILHLLVSVGLHLWAIYLQRHDVFGIFSYKYSYFALAYFVFFAWRSWTVKIPRRIPKIYADTVGGNT